MFEEGFFDVFVDKDLCVVGVDLIWGIEVFVDGFVYGVFDICIVKDD